MDSQLEPTLELLPYEYLDTLGEVVVLHSTTIH